MLNIALNKLKYNIENAMVRKKLIKVTFPDGTVICLSSRYMVYRESTAEAFRGQRKSGSS